MNLLLSLPIGIVLISVTYLILSRVFKESLLMLAGILALVVAMVYSMLAAISWPGADVYAIHLALYMLTIYGMTIILKQRRTKSKLHWGPIAIFTFFGIILITDSVFILLAQSGMSPEWVQRILPEPKGKSEVRSVFPGTVSHDFREKESQFNEYQQQREAQEKLGWQVKPGWRESAIAGKPNQLLLELKDKDNKFIKDAKIQLRFLYPADMKRDQTLNMTYHADGLYRADVILNHIGDWDMIVNISHAAGDYELRNRTTIKALNK